MAATKSEFCNDSYRNRVIISVFLFCSVMDSVLHKNRGDQVLSLLHKSDIPQDRQRQQRTRVENQHSRLRNLPGKFTTSPKKLLGGSKPMPHSDFDNEITTIVAHSSTVLFSSSRGVSRQSLIGAYLPEMCFAICHP